MPSSCATEQELAPIFVCATFPVPSRGVWHHHRGSRPSGIVFFPLVSPFCRQTSGNIRDSGNDNCGCSGEHTASHTDGSASLHARQAHQARRNTNATPLCAANTKGSTFPFDHHKIWYDRIFTSSTLHFTMERRKPRNRTAISSMLLSSKLCVPHGPTLPSFLPSFLPPSLPPSLSLSLSSSLVAQAFFF